MLEPFQSGIAISFYQIKSNHGSSTVSETVNESAKKDPLLSDSAVGTSNTSQLNIAGSSGTLQSPVLPVIQSNTLVSIPTTLEGFFFFKS